MACVVPKPDYEGQITSEEILAYLQPLVAKWWLPDEVVFVEAIPKTSVGKFDKKVLRSRFIVRRERPGRSSRPPW